jgi:low temperature requirement protein LtrA
LRPPVVRDWTGQMSYPQRRMVSGEEQQATNPELFYDLVFVFAVTQVSHLILAHLDWTGPSGL